MATKQIDTDSFTLASTWRVEYQTGGNQYLSRPSMGSITKTFAYSLPTGSVIKKASVWATLGNPLSGIGAVKANGVSMNQKYNAERGADVSLSGISGTLSVKFEFRAQGSLDNVGNRTARLSFSNVYLWIEYEQGNILGSGSSGNSSSKSGAGVTSYQAGAAALAFLPSPPQSVCLINQSNWHVYLFDGVNKVQHDATVDINEEPSKKKEEYTNGARNEPDQVTLDVLMSDVYADKGDLYHDAGSFSSSQRTAFEWTRQMLLPPYMNSSTWSRSQNAMYTLKKLKYDRQMLSIITPHYVYTDMIIESITATWDNTCTFGLIAQIKFKGVYESITSSKNTTSSVPTSSEQRPTPSIAAQNGIHW